MGGGRSGAGAGDFSDVFGDMFGDIFGGRRGGTQQGGQRGSDLRYNLEISLEEAVHGTDQKIRIPVLVSCDSCSGSGAKAGSAPVTCSMCHGHGQVRCNKDFSRCNKLAQPVVVLENKSKIHAVNATVKDGLKTKTLSAKIPAGVDTGDRIRLTGEGEAGQMGAPSGDLYIEIQVKRHTIFSRDGANLSCEVPISFVTACIGGEIEVPTLGESGIENSCRNTNRASFSFTR